MLKVYAYVKLILSEHNKLRDIIVPLMNLWREKFLCFILSLFMFMYKKDANK